MEISEADSETEAVRLALHAVDAATLSRLTRIASGMLQSGPADYQALAELRRLAFGGGDGCRVPAAVLIDHALSEGI